MKLTVVSEKVLTIACGLSLATLSGVMLFRGFAAGFIRIRGHSYSLVDSPVGFGVAVSLLIVVAILGLLLAIHGLRPR